MPGTMPKMTEESAAYFHSIVPDDPRVTTRPMFGNMAAFVNGNMFITLLGDEISVRLSEDDRTELLGEDGTTLFEPMQGRPMKEYVVLPMDWYSEPDRIDPWIGRSLDWVGQMPEKKPKSRKQKSQ